MKRQFQAQRLDVVAFAEDAAELSGRTPLQAFARLAAEARAAADAHEVSWSAQGELRNAGHLDPQAWLHLHAQASVPMVCQRCMEPVEVPLEVERSFRFVADETVAAAEDDESDEDLLVTSREFDLPALIEDELLMEVPVVPRHDICPVPLPMSSADAAYEEAPEPVNPFAALKALKTRPE
jgi:uncharacterized protein